LERAKDQFQDASCKLKEQRPGPVLAGRGLVRARTEVMLASPGSWARWREEVIPGRAFEEVILALTHQEAKTKKRASKLKQSDQNQLILSS
jgi:hypothetical protein